VASEVAGVADVNYSLVKCCDNFIQHLLVKSTSDSHYHKH